MSQQRKKEILDSGLLSKFQKGQSNRKNPPHRFIGPSPWSDRTPTIDNTTVVPSPKGTRTCNFTQLVKSFFRSWIISLIQWSIRLTIFWVLVLSVTSFRAIRCHLAQSRLYPLTRFICTIAYSPSLSPLGPLCSVVMHAQDAEEFCNRYEPFQFLLDAFTIINQEHRVNYASLNGGAVIIPEFTSQTHGRTPCSGSKSNILACNLEKNSRINPPSIVLEDALGNDGCWEFSGAKGQIAINLTEPVVLTHISIGHPSHFTSRAHLRAPKSMTLWALVDNVLPVKRDGNTSALLQPALRVRPESHSPMQNFLAMLPLHPPNPGSFVHMASFEYDVYKSSGLRQNFFLNHTQVKTQTVLLQIDGNFGGDTTCLHWVGMYSV